MVRLNMVYIAGNDVLAGALEGRRALAALIHEFREPSSPQPVVLDFSDVRIATASFLRESVFPFREVARARRSNGYPVVGNVSDLIRDEFEVLLKARADALLSCKLTESGEVVSTELLGSLDPKQQIAFDAVNHSGETDAATLLSGSGPADGVGQTAWNNRLATLVARGLILEIQQGRTKRYRPVLTER